jgi:DNA-binding Lrp family transcriptional regulator
MVRAFVLVQTEIEVARTKEVVTALRQLVSGIKTAHAVTGPYDVIAEVEGETSEEITTMVEEKVHFVPGVYRTVTCFVI